MLERVGLNIVIQVAFNENVITQQKDCLFVFFFFFFLHRISLMPMKIHSGKVLQLFGTEF